MTIVIDGIGTVEHRYDDVFFDGVLDRVFVQFSGHVSAE